MIRRSFLKSLFLVSVILNAFIGLGANRYWVGTGSNTSWNNTVNWSVNSDGTGSGASVPSSSDIAIFNSYKLGNCNLNIATVSIAGINVNTGYTGTITQDFSNVSFTIGSSNAVFAAGTFTGNTSGESLITINGTFTLSGCGFTSTTGVLTFNNTVTSTSGTFTHNNGTVTFNSSSAQTIPTWSYYNLTSSNSGTRTLSGGTINVFNTFAPFSNSYTTTGNTLNFNGTASQTIPGFSNTSSSYNNLTSSSTGTRTLSGTIRIKGVFTKGSNAYTTTGSTVEYNGSGGQTIIAFNYYNLTISGIKSSDETLAPTGVINIANIFTNSATFTSGGFVNAGSTVGYNGTGAQTVIAFNYNRLTISGSRGSANVTLANGPIGIAGIFTATATFTTGGYITTGNTIDYNGNVTQTVIAFNYNNLTFSSTGSRTLASTGRIRIAGTFTKGTNAHTITGSTVEFNGTGAQTIPAYDYCNLVISGTRVGNITFDNGSTFYISKNFIPLANLNSGYYYLASGTTFEFNGALPQVIPSFPFGNVISSSTGERGLVSSGVVQIAGTLNKGSNTFININAGGNSFIPLYSAESGNLGHCHSIDPNTAVIVGDGGVILKTTDGGSTWIKQVSNTTNNLRFVSFYDMNNGLIVGSSGLVLRTTNAGGTWTSSTPTTQTLSGIYYLSSSVVFITCANGTIIKSTDGGATWGTPQTVAVPAQGLYGMYFTDANTGYVVGNAGVIYKTTNGGTSWTAQTSGATSFLLSSVYFTDANTGYVTGAESANYTSIVLKTTNGGTSWSTVATSNRYLGNINFVDANTAYIAGGDVNNNLGYISKTTDAGLTWTTVPTGTSRLSGLKMFNSTTGFCGGLDGNVIKVTCCTDGGTVEFNGSANQSVEGTGSLSVNKLRIAKSNEKVTLNIPITITKSLELVGGIIQTTSTNYLKLEDNASSTPGSDISYISGPMRKTGNDAFTFPLGDITLTSGAYHPLAITAPSSTTDEFTAQYYSSTIPYNVNNIESNISAIDVCDYFTLDRNQGASVVLPTLNWNANSCVADVPDDLLVVGWDGSIWKSLGNSSSILLGQKGSVSAEVGLNISNSVFAFGESKLDPQSNPCTNDSDKNWLSSKTFDGNGSIISESRVYADYLGKTTQTQTRALTDNNVLTSQIIYDAYGREVIQTLAAPINQSELCYKDQFISSDGENDYNFVDFDIPNNTTLANNLTYGEVDKPKPVYNNTLNTLGWYYSNKNTMEPFVPSSSFPYSRTEYDDNNGGVVKRTAAAGDLLRMGSGHENYNISMPIANGELINLYGYAGWDLAGAFGIDSDSEGWSNGYSNGTGCFRVANAIKTINVDQNGIEKISFYDTEKKLLATCLSGPENEENIKIVHVQSIISPQIETQRFVDIHLPVGCENSLVIQNLNTVEEQKIRYNIQDLKTGKFIYFNGSIDFIGTEPNLPPGYYRIIYNYGANTMSDLYVSYDLNYNNFTLNYYDKAGRLKVSIPPNGIDQSYSPYGSVINQNISAKFNYISSPNSGEPYWNLNSPGNDDVLSKSLTPPVNPAEQLTNIKVSLSRSNIAVVGVDHTYRSQATEESLIPQSIIIEDDYTGPFNPADPSDPPPDGGSTVTYTYKIEFDAYNNDNVMILDNSILYAYRTVATGFISGTPTESWRVSYPVRFAIDALLSRTTNSLNVKITNITETRTPYGQYPVPVLPIDDKISLVHLNIFSQTIGLPGLPIHKMPKTFDYNSSGLLLSSESPDEGKTEYVYRADGQIRFSQNSLQRSGSTDEHLRKFSYINYDSKNRIIETGDYDPNLAGTPPDESGTPPNIFFQNHYDYVPSGYVGSWASVHTRLETNSLDPLRCVQKKSTMYDTPDPNFNAETDLSSANYVQSFVANKMSKTWNNAQSTWYSYDEIGRVKWLVIRIENMPSNSNSYSIKTINYKYDFNGNLTEIEYNKEISSESFNHYYTYDLDKRLIKVETKTASSNKEEQANYIYYAHGPIKRVELANKIQGVDYVYTINGLLKAINAPELNERDPGKDGRYGSVHHVPKDLFGLTLDYFSGDYIREGTFVQTYDTPENYDPEYSGPPIIEKAKNLYNGTIKAQRWQTFSNTIGIAYPNNQLMYGYLYDKKYQIKEATFGTVSNSGTLNKDPLPPGQFDLFSGYRGPELASSSFTDYKISGIIYDLNGNIKNINRNSYENNQVPSQLSMDQLTYTYYDGTNQLEKVTDNITSSYWSALNFKNGQNNTNYSYDKIGQLSEDESESNYYNYDNSGKVIAIYRDLNRTRLKALYTYNENGFRVIKTTYTDDLVPVVFKETFYVRDASGNELSMYEKQGSSIVQTETGIFASGRIGTHLSSNENMYELKDNLGNVRTTFSKVVDYSLEFGFDNSKEDDYLINFITSSDFTKNRLGLPGGAAKLDAINSTGPNVNIPVTLGQVITANVYSFFASGSATGFLKFDLKDASGTIISSQTYNIINSPGTWNALSASYTVSNNASSLTLSVYPVLTGTITQAVWFDDLSISLTSNSSGIGIIKPEALSLTDYYPHGGIMPGRHYEGTDKYRFGYQGQFSEKDDETGFNNFELRLYDSKLGRWMSPDPYHQYPSPYIGMGNNPINLIDTDGGYANWSEDPSDYYLDKNNKIVGYQPSNQTDRIFKEDQFGTQTLSGSELKFTLNKNPGFQFINVYVDPLLPGHSAIGMDGWTIGFYDTKSMIWSEMKAKTMSISNFEDNYSDANIFFLQVSYEQKEIIRNNLFGMRARANNHLLNYNFVFKNCTTMACDALNSGNLTFKGYNDMYGMYNDVKLNYSIPTQFNNYLIDQYNNRNGGSPVKAWYDRGTRIGRSSMFYSPSTLYN